MRLKLTNLDIPYTLDAVGEWHANQVTGWKYSNGISHNRALIADPVLLL